MAEIQGIARKGESWKKKIADIDAATTATKKVISWLSVE